MKDLTRLPVSSWLSLTLACALSGCTSREEAVTSQNASSPGALTSAMQPHAGIRDIMVYLVDPAADFLWQSVSTVATVQGVDEHRPRTDAEWEEVRKHAMLLTEASNLLLVQGRHVARKDQRLEGEGEPGNLSPEEVERAVAIDFPAYTSFAQALRQVGAGMVVAADAQDAEQLLLAGDTLDEVCESCHLQFWYPQEPRAD